MVEKITSFVRTTRGKPSDGGLCTVRRKYRVGLALASIFSVAVRLPFLRAPISGDEGGYAAAAYWWSTGNSLYRGPILDRPQLLAVVYRIAIWLTPRSAVGIRLMAMLFGVFSTVLVGMVAQRLSGSRRVGLGAAFVYSLVGSSPSLEAFSAYGELLAGVPTLSSIYFFLIWLSKWGPQERVSRLATRSRTLIFCSGAAGASATLMKQSGFDGLATVLVLLCAFVTLGPSRINRFLRSSADLPTRSEAFRNMAMFGLGSVSVALVAIVHGADSGLVRYWDSVAGYRIKYLSATSASGGDKLALLVGNTNRIAPLLLCLVVMVAIGWRSAGRQARIVTLVWGFFSVLGFLAGGLYWLHYFIEPVLAMCPLAGLGVVRLTSKVSRPRRPRSSGNTVVSDGSRWPLGGTIVVAVLAALVVMQNSAAWNLASRRDGSERAIELDHKYFPVAQYLREHTSESDTIQPLWQSGAVTFYAQRRPATPYMWATWFDSMPGAKELLVMKLGQSAGPKYVALLHELKIMPGFQPVSAALVANYRLETMVDGTEIWRRKA